MKKHGIRLGKLDATAHSKTAGAYAISGYPTLKIFRNGKAYDYNGPRKSDGIVKYMLKQVGPAAKTVTTVDELEKMMRADEAVQYVVVLFAVEGKQSQLGSSFALLSSRMRDEFLFARSSDVQLKRHYGIAEDEEKLVVFLRGEKTIYNGGSRTSDVEAFIRENSLPLVGEYSEATAAQFNNRKLPIAKLFLNNIDRKVSQMTTAARCCMYTAIALANSSGSADVSAATHVRSVLHRTGDTVIAMRVVSLLTCLHLLRLSLPLSQPNSKTMQYYINRLKKVAEKFRGKLLVTYADKKDQSRSVDHFNIADVENAFVIEDVANNKQYRFDEDTDEEDAAKKKKKPAGLNVEGWLQFAQQFVDGALSPYVRSQRAPKDNMQRPVKIATAMNFDEVVNDDTKDVMIEFYAPW